MEQAHDRVEILRSVRLLGHAHQSTRPRLGDQTEQLAGTLERRARGLRIDMDAEHADGAGALDALGRVVEEDDRFRRHAERLGGGEVGVGMGLAHTQVRGVDERVEVGELGTAFEERRLVDRVRVVRQHTDPMPRRFGVTHERNRGRLDEAVGHHVGISR